MSLGELRMFDIDRNYIANVGTPSATSTYSGFNVSAAYDNDNGTLWAGANTTPEDTITFVYDSAVEPVEIEVKARASGSQSSFNQTPSAATLQYSTDSGVTWQDWISYTGQSFTAYGQSKFFLKPEFALANNLDVYGGSYPFWRVEFAVGDAVSVSEIEWRGSSGGVNLATGGTATASNTFSGFNVDNAFDGDTSTSWASAVGSTQSVTYEFTEAVECTHIALTPRSGFVSQAPSDIKIYVSVNGVDWALWDDTIPTQTGWTDLEEREIALTRPASSFP